MHHLFKVAPIPDQAFHPFHKPTIPRVQIVLERGREHVVDLVLECAQAVAQLGDEVLAFAAHAVGVDACLRLLQGQYPDP